MQGEQKGGNVLSGLQSWSFLLTLPSMQFRAWRWWSTPGQRQSPLLMYLTHCQLQAKCTQHARAYTAVGIVTKCKPHFEVWKKPASKRVKFKERLICNFCTILLFSSDCGTWLADFTPTEANAWWTSKVWQGTSKHLGTKVLGPGEKQKLWRKYPM